jgi:hypothetical protein
MEELIRKYIKEHLWINLKEESYGYNGRCITIELKLDDDVISSDSYTLSHDED